MECIKWEEQGLLYTSGELSAEESKAFEVHLEDCNECKGELSLYKSNKEVLFTPSNLEVVTSAELDARVKDACMKIPKPAVSSGAFFALVRRSVLSILVLALGLGGGFYVAYNLQTNGGTAVATQDVGQQGVAEASGADSLGERSDMDIARPAGDLNAPGVVPVDVQSR